jgi:hypothetical protein
MYSQHPDAFEEMTRAYDARITQYEPACSDLMKKFYSDIITAINKDYVLK